MNIDSAAPIGIFDSGVGGLSVFLEIKKELPQESYVYVADSTNVPYGNKSPEFIVKRSLEISNFLIQKHNVKALVVACNTATAAAISILRQKWPDIPIVGMEPALKPALSLTQKNKIGVLATVGTLKSSRFAALLDKYTGSASIYTQAAPGLVELVENGDLSSENSVSIVRDCVNPLLAKGVDVIVLGCTHYPFLKNNISMLVGKDIFLVDTGAAVARQLKRQLEKYGLIAKGASGHSVDIFYSTDHKVQSHSVIFSKLIGEKVVVSLFSDS